MIDSAAPPTGAPFRRRSFRAAALLLLLGACAEAPTTLSSRPEPAPARRLLNGQPYVVISEVYGGGGNAGATLKNDFVELYNPTTSSIDLTGWSIQYASAAGTNWSATNLVGSVPALGYYLIKLAQGAGGSVDLPTPNVTGTLALGAAAGKVALVKSTALLSGSCPVGGATVVDFVGYGTANCSETAPTAATANATAALRNGSPRGAVDTDHNGSDFTVATPALQPSYVASGPAIATIVVAPATATISTGQTQAFTATAYDASSAVVSGVTFSWSSSNTAVASVSPAGVAAGITAGTATIRASASGVIGSASLTVNAVSVTLPATRFTEVHYDNNGTDFGERLEIEGPGGTDLTGWSVALYNGANGEVYDTRPLSGTIPTVCSGGRGVVVVRLPQDGVQNGAPDGFALVNASSTVVEFLSYEGTFAATAGPAVGMTSTDIGIAEVPTNQVPLYGKSLKRDATGAWTGGTDAHFGACNDGSGGTAQPNGGVTFSGRSAFNDPPLPAGFQSQIFGNPISATGASVDEPVTWTSVTPNLASVDSRGVITALAAGAATFRATTPSGFVGEYVLPMTVGAQSNVTFDGNTEFGTPTDATPLDDYVLARREYTSSFSPVRNTPNWVSYRINSTNFGLQDRCNCFTYDPELPANFPRYTTADYTGAGEVAGYLIDRGHLARSADRTAGSLDNARTFYFSNIIPQAAAVNQGPWAVMESFLGDQARVGGKQVYVVTGVAGSKGTVKNEGLITIPAYVWKVAVIMPMGQGLSNVTTGLEPELVAVVMPNDPSINPDWTTYKVTVDSVEALSGYDLLALLPDQIETQLEKGNLFPVVTLTPPATWTAGTSASLGIRWTDSSVKDAPFTVRVNWGDGTANTSFLSTVIPSTDIRRPHTYAAPGPYTITVTVTDRGGATSTKTLPIVVTP